MRPTTNLVNAGRLMPPSCGGARRQRSKSPPGTSCIERLCAKASAIRDSPTHTHTRIPNGPSHSATADKVQVTHLYTQRLPRWWAARFRPTPFAIVGRFVLARPPTAVLNVPMCARRKEATLTLQTAEQTCDKHGTLGGRRVGHRTDRHVGDEFTGLTSRRS